MGWVKGEGARFEDGTVPGRIQRMEDKIKREQKSEVWDQGVWKELGYRAEGFRDLETD